VITFIYFLIPLLLAILIYWTIPSLFRKSLQLTEISVLNQVQEVMHIMGLPEFSRVCTTPKKISPFVFGRRNKKAMLVLPHNFKTFLSEKEQKAVIIHELSHIKQKDVGFFTWLTLLIEGLK
jgi:beta-lactamase regulating signal transducer with metallopeptidase domain